jgi:hypothetical protein
MPRQQQLTPSTATTVSNGTSQQATRSRRSTLSIDTAALPTVAEGDDDEMMTTIPIEVGVDRLQADDVRLRIHRMTDLIRGVRQ